MAGKLGRKLLRLELERHHGPLAVATQHSAHATLKALSSQQQQKAVRHFGAFQHATQHAFSVSGWVFGCAWWSRRRRRAPQTHKHLQAPRKIPITQGALIGARVMHTARKRKQSSVLRECTVHREAPRVAKCDGFLADRRSRERKEHREARHADGREAKKQEKEKEHLTGGPAAPTA